MMQVVDHVETRRLVLRRWTLQDPRRSCRGLREAGSMGFPFQRGLTHEETEAFLRRKLDEWESRGWLSGRQSPRRMVP